MKRPTVEVSDDLIRKAWDFLWRLNLETRRKNEIEYHRTGKWPYRHNETYYITAADMENQLRLWAEDIADGKSLSQHRAFSGGAWVRIPGNLNHRVRNFLLRSPHITGHNFGRGHISGMRFRPRGEPISDTELATMERKEKQKSTPRPIHLYRKGGLLCTTKKRSIWSRGRSQARTTSDVEKVTCVRCKNLLAQETADE